MAWCKATAGLGHLFSLSLCSLHKFTEYDNINKTQEDHEYIKGKIICLNFVLIVNNNVICCFQVLYYTMAKLLLKYCCWILEQLIFIITKSIFFQMLIQTHTCGETCKTFASEFQVILNYCALVAVMHSMSCHLWVRLNFIMEIVRLVLIRLKTR